MISFKITLADPIYAINRNEIDRCETTTPHEDCKFMKR